jgi:hypothetical protein
MILAQNNNTPVSFWMSLPLWKLPQWIKVNNIVIAETKKGTFNGRQTTRV